MFEREENLEISDGECKSARKMEKKTREEKKKKCANDEYAAGDSTCTMQNFLVSILHFSAGLEKHTEQMNIGKRNSSTSCATISTSIGISSLHRNPLNSIIVQKEK